MNSPSQNGNPGPVALWFTVVVKCGEGEDWMGAVNPRAKKGNSDAEAATVRATISFPADRYSTLEEIAKQKKVSLAWVVREAVDNYIEAKWPLLMQR